MTTILSLWKGALPVRYTMASILDQIAEQYGVSVADLRGPDRTKAISTARQHAMWLMAQQPHLSLPQIGRYLNGRDHTTILHGIRQHQARLDAESPALLERAA